MILQKVCKECGHINVINRNVIGKDETADNIDYANEDKPRFKETVEWFEDSGDPHMCEKCGAKFNA